MRTPGATRSGRPPVTQPFGAAWSAGRTATRSAIAAARRRAVRTRRRLRPGARPVAYELPATTGPWPPELDPLHYREVHADLAPLTGDELIEHWFIHGIAEGRAGSPAATRGGFELQLATSGSVLEIGPLDTPVVRGSNVEYFDVVPTEELRQKAAALGRDPAGCPDIDHVSAVGDLSVVTRTFDRVVSSHSVEHQPDLVAHLVAVADLLGPEGAYLLIVPDARYCFDHFLPPSSIADVLGAHARRATLHDPRHVINTIAMRAHNDAPRHWAGDHGRPAWREEPSVLGEAYRFCTEHPDAYLDTHAWQFTPSTFREIVDTLFTLGLSPLRPARVYETVRDSIEFYAVLEKPA